VKRADGTIAMDGAEAAWARYAKEGAQDQRKDPDPYPDLTFYSDSIR
jgi:hypothetical protein